MGTSYGFNREKVSLFVKTKARLLLKKLQLSGRSFNKSYYEVEDDGLTTAEHIALNDKYIRCFIKFKVPMSEMKNEKRAEWVSNDLTCIIGTFTYDHWYNLYLKIGLDMDVAKQCIVIKSPEQEEKLKLDAEKSKEA